MITREKEKEKIQAFENLLALRKILNRLKIKVILDGGTLLGAYRDNDFCEDDHNDIDLTTLNSSEKAIDLIEMAGEVGFSLYHYWRKDDMAEHSTAQISFIKDKMKIDIMFKELKGDKAWWTIFAGPNVTYKSVPAHFYSERKQYLFKNKRFMIPKNTEDYLQLRYGDWKIPVHRKEFSCFKTDKVIRANYEEI